MVNGKTVLGSSGVLLLAAALLCAGDPWKDKPYTQWTQKEVRKVTLNSPWARPVRILSGQLDLSRPGGPQGQQTGPGPSISMGGGGGSPGGGSGGSGSGAGGGRLQFVVQWASSLTIRQALVRRQALRGPVDEEAAAQFLSNTPPYYVIIVSGPDMRGFEELGDEAVKASAYLELKRSHQKVPPAIVNFVQPGPRLTRVEFYFAREQDVKPVVTLEEKKVKFYCESGTAEVSTEFDLRKMTRESELDL